MQCLNTSNKEVKAALDEVASVLGSEDAAYYIISENNGFAIDLAPNGALSKLFSDLLEYYKGDREKAIKSKVMIYSNNFRNWFGDWINDSENSSKVVDENGEPLIVYHGSNSKFNVFNIDSERNNGFSDGAYFTTNKKFAKAYTTKGILYPTFLSIKKPIQIDNDGKNWRLVGFKYVSKLLNVDENLLETLIKPEYDPSLTLLIKDLINGNKDNSSKFYSMNSVVKLARLLNYDGMIATDVLDSGKYFLSSLKNYNADQIVILDPNQVKSINNNGEFSNTNNNIHENLRVKLASNFFEGIESVVGTYYDNTPQSSTTSGEIIDRLKKYIPTDSISYKLLDLFKFTDVYIGVTEKMDVSDGSYMWYSVDTNTVWIYKPYFEKTDMLYNANSIVHELVHAFTSRSIENVKNGNGTALEIAVYNKVKELLELNRKLYQDEFIEKGKWTGSFYGLKDEDEFIAEFLTNEEFVNNIIDNARQRNKFELIIDKIKEVWQAIINLLVEDESVKINSNESIEDLLMLLLSFNTQDNNESVNEVFEKSLSNEIKQIENTIHEAERYHFDTKEELDKRLSQIRSRLLEGLKSRLRSIDIKDIGKRTEVIENIKYQIANIQNEAINNFDVIASFIQDLQLDVREVGRKVVNAYKGSTDALSDEELVNLNKNYFSFYCEQAKDIYNSLVNLDAYKNIIGVENYNNIMSQLQLCKTILDASYDAVKRMQVVNAQKVLLNEGVKVNSPTIFNYISEKTHDTDFDINYITRVLGSGDRINDEAIKSLFNILLNTENSINAVTFEKANELNKLLKAAGNRNQKLLFEVDENGNTTGYIIRDLNYGKFYKDLKEFKQQLQKDFGIDPLTLFLPENINTRIEYNKRLNEWLSEHCERKYTAEFYNLMNSLSPEASYAREIIMSKIRTLSNKYRDVNGIIHYESMTNDEWNTLQKYELDKKELASIYDIYGNEKPEGSVERQIADELTALNKSLYKNLQHKYNQDDFQKLIDEKRNSLSKKEFNKWMQRNTRVVYTEEFYEELGKIERIDYGENYAEYSKLRSAILNMFRDNRTGEVNPNLMPKSAKRKVDKLDLLMRNIRKLKGKGAKRSDAFNKIARVSATDIFKTDEAEALALDQTLPGSSELFYLENTYFTLNNANTPKSWYTKIVPKDSKYIQIIPTSNLSELSSESPFVNKNYKQDNDEYYQPKRSLYDNSKKYKQVMSNKALADLRQALIDTIEESNSKLNNLEYLNKYRLPQISGSMYKYLKASGFNPFKGIKNYILDVVTRKNDDVGINNNVLTAPDGTSLALIPQYFTKMLDDPATISADMVGSVILYFRMAENFKQKNDIKGTVENIKSFLAQRRYTGTTGLNSIRKIFGNKQDPKKGTDTNIYKFAEKFINMNLYDVRTNSLSIQIGDREVSISKILTRLTGLGTLVNLGLNFACAFTGLFTAAHAHLINSITGRYYTFSNALTAFKDLIFDLLRYGPSVGRRTYKSQLMAYMDYFEVGSTLNSLYNHTNRPAIINILTDQWAFGIYSMSDYFIKGLILNCVMYDYKYVDGEFMHHEAFYNKYGRTDATELKWSKAKSFKALTKVSAGKIVAVSPLYQEAIDKIKDNIGNTARQLAGSADGQLSPLQKAQMSANVFGAMCMMHRQYIPIILQLSFTMDKQWDYQSQREVEAILRTPFRVFMQTYRDKNGLDLLTTLSKLVFLNKGFSSDLDRRNIKKLKLEVLFTMMLYPLLRNALKEEADKDKRDVLLNLFAYIMARTSFETTAPYDLFGIYNTIKTPTPLYSLLDNVGFIFSYPIDLIQSNLRDKKNKKTKIITRGAYKGKTPFERTLWKLTPFKNIIELNDIPSKRRYYDTQITGD